MKIGENKSCKPDSTEDMNVTFLISLADTAYSFIVPQTCSNLTDVLKCCLATGSCTPLHCTKMELKSYLQIFVD